MGRAAARRLQTRDMAPRRNRLTTREALAALADDRRRHDELVLKIVAAARDEGLAWEQIGHELGMSGEGARKKFGRDLPAV